MADCLALFAKRGFLNVWKLLLNRSKYAKRLNAWALEQLQIIAPSLLFPSVYAVQPKSPKFYAPR